MSGRMSGMSLRTRCCSSSACWSSPRWPSVPCCAARRRSAALAAAGVRCPAGADGHLGLWLTLGGVVAAGGRRGRAGRLAAGRPRAPARSSWPWTCPTAWAPTTSRRAGWRPRSRRRRRSSTPSPTPSTSAWSGSTRARSTTSLPSADRSAAQGGGPEPADLRWHLAGRGHPRFADARSPARRSRSARTARCPTSGTGARPRSCCSPTARTPAASGGGGSDAATAHRRSPRTPACTSRPSASAPPPGRRSRSTGTGCTPRWTRTR